VTKNKQKQILVIGQPVSPSLADDLARAQHFTQIAQTVCGLYGSGEPYTEIFKGAPEYFASHAESIKNAHAVILQSASADAGNDTLHILQLAHTLKRHGATKITAVMPFAPFARQDRDFANKFCSVTADLFPKLLRAAGVDSVITLTPHSKSAVGFFEDAFGSNFTAIAATDLFAEDIRRQLGSDSLTLCIGAPDGAEKPADEGQARARSLVQRVFNTAAARPDDMYRISKVHTAASATKITSFDGNVTGKDCVIVDDMIDGGSTMLNAARELKRQGAKSVHAYATHGILSGNALEKIMMDGAIDALVVTDTMPDTADKRAALEQQRGKEMADKVRILPTSTLIAQ